MPTRPSFALVTFAVLRTSARIFPYIERGLLPFSHVSKPPSSFATANVRQQADIGARWALAGLALNLSTEPTQTPVNPKFLLQNDLNIADCLA